MEYSIPSSAGEYNGHHYYVYEGGTCHSWDEAVNYCNSLGGHMAVINDEDENTFLYQFMKKSGYSNAYFGLTDVDHQGTWSWVNGDSSTYRNWNPGEPGNSGEHYAMFYENAQEYCWNDGTFGDHYGDIDRTFICEWESEPQTIENQYDIVFVLDKSDSMNNPITDVKNNIESFVNQLNADGVDIQLGLIAYEDASAIQKYDLTNDVNTFISNVNSISTSGGKEDGLTAITDASNGALSLNFRGNSNKEIILVTDEDYDDGNTISVSDVTRMLNDNNVKLDVFGKKDSGNTNSCEDHWTPIANATSGQLINGDTVNGQFYDIQNDFSTLFKAALIDGVPVTGTHQVSFTQWSFGYTPTDAAAALASDPNSSITITPNA